MTEIRCKNCNHCLSKDVKLGAGMFYMNPSRPLEVFQEVRKCPSCGMFNEVTIELDLTIKIKIVEEKIPNNRVDIVIMKNRDLYSA